MIAGTITRADIEHPPQAGDARILHIGIKLDTGGYDDLYFKIFKDRANPGRYTWDDPFKEFLHEAGITAFSFNSLIGLKIPIGANDAKGGEGV